MKDDAHSRPQLGVGARLDTAPSRTLVEAAFRSELEHHSAFLYEGLSYADLAHTLVLVERGVVPQEAGKRLLEELVSLHDAGLAGLPLDAKWGDLYDNRDAELRRRLGPAAGWLHAGRARREALTLGWMLELRKAGTDLVLATAAALREMAALCERHAATLMPDFTYLQHAQPTTLGHYLLGFAYPLARDAERVRAELRHVNSSPAGSASTNGSRLALDRERLRELLGFERLIVHNRDAMWQPDLGINLMANLVSLATTADRLSEDLQIWATEEFGFVELADQHCRTSVIMPNKKNPFALTHIRGRARDLTGKLVSVIATNQTPSGQVDNRNTAYLVLPEALATVRSLVELLSEVLVHARFDEKRLRAQADTGFTYGTDLADLLVERERIDSRTAHEIVGKVVALQIQNGGDQGLGVDLAREFQRAAGRALATDVAALLAELTAARIVESRTGIGGCAPDAVRRMTAEVRRQAESLAREVSAATGFPDKLRQSVSERIGKAW